MKVLRILLYILIGLVGLFVILGLLAPKEFSVTRSTEIDAPRSTVFKHIKTFENRDVWSPWYAMDPNVERNVEGTDGEVGAKQSWEGNPETVGTGSQTITEIVDNESVKTALQFVIPFESNAEGLLNLDDADGGKTKTSWTLSGKHGFVESVIMMFMDMDASVGADFEKGLGMLKEVCEKEAAEAVVGISEMEVDGIKYVGVRETVKWAEMSTFFENNFGKVAQYITQKGMAMKGQPRGIYYTWDKENQQTEMVAAIPVSEAPDMGKPAKTAKMDGYDTDIYDGKLVCNYYGSYENLGSAHETIGKWLGKQGKKQLSPVMEEYVTDPSTEPDPKKWLTRIYYSFE